MVLFDFADIESWDPEGKYYPNDSDACHWCLDWCADHDCPTCGYCAHSRCFNCYQKGKAFWWLLATLHGWLATADDNPEQPTLPSAFTLKQNYPNPFNPDTHIEFTLAAPGDVTLSIYNTAGQLVETLLDRQCSAGSHTVAWAAEGHASGVYFYRLATVSGERTRKMLLLK
jgi:hypothetical protein